MNMKNKQIQFILVLLLGFILGSFWTYTRPQIYKQARSPDRSWTVQVFRKHTPPYLEGVAVIVRVIDSKGDTVLNKVIDHRDLWMDVDERYPEVICENDEIRVGPKWWNGTEFDYYRIRKTDFEPVN
jgi:hypothetical protein